MKHEEETKNKIDIPREKQHLIASILGHLAGVGMSGFGVTKNEPRQPQPHYCMKCDRKMNQASKHTWVCPVCRKREEIK